jgi:cell division protein FtsL
MVRVLNFFCVALMGLSILALYHVSEKTRVAHMQMNQAVRQIAQEKAHIGVLETEWQHVASPERIQELAQARLNMTDTASAQLSSFDQLPRRGADAPAPGNSSVHNASAQLPAAPVPTAIPVSQTTSDPGM